MVGRKIVALDAVVRFHARVPAHNSMVECPPDKRDTKVQFLLGQPIL